MALENPLEQKSSKKPEHFLILGPGGSGMTTALDIFADFGYLTVAGVDPEQIHNTVAPLSQGQAPVAFSLRLSAETDMIAVAQSIEALRQNLPSLRVLTLNAPQEVLLQRYLKSEKMHAFEGKNQSAGLQEAIGADKKLNEAFVALKDYAIDTSTTTAIELRHKIAKVLGVPIDNQEFTVYIKTFGFKYGAPQDAEMIFDMRFMTNPFYDEALRPLNGRDKPVRDYIFGMEPARIFFEKWSDLIADILPLYQAQGKTRLTIGVGCTGGKHRSVCMAEALALYLKEHTPDYTIVVNHREMLKWDNASLPATLPSAGERP